MKLKSIIAFLCFLFAAIANGQDEYYFRHYQVENGLSHNTVMCALQDDLGFMWLGTKDGLNRFDGTSFKVFRHDDDDTTTIGNDYIRYLFKDKKGQIYVGTQRGLYKYHPLSESFTHIKSSGTKSIKEVMTDTKGNLWYIAEGLLVQCSEKENKVREFPIEKYSWATSMCTTEDGTFWVSTSDGILKKYDSENDAFQSFNVFRDIPATTRWIEKIASSKNGKIFIGTAANGMLSLDRTTNVVASIISQNNDGTGIFVRDILPYQKGEYWIATESGVFVYNEAKNSLVNLKKNYQNPYSISDNAVYTLCRDKEGGLWAGTFFGGVNYYAQHHALFQKYFPDESKTTISGNAVREIVKDKYGNLWIGTEDAGLNKLDPQGRFTHFMPTGKQGSLSYYNVHGLMAVNEELWVGTFEHGLDVMDIRTGKVIRHYKEFINDNGLISNFVFSITQTRDKKMLVGTTAGVFIYRPEADDFVPIKQLSGYIYHVLEDRQGVWWAATIAEGIKFYDPISGESGSFQNDPKNANSISINMVNSLFEDSKGNLWMATEGGGACRLSADRKTFKRFTSKNGLPSNYVFKILEDNDKQLWITTSLGLVQLNAATETIKIYTSANGLLNDQFNYNSGYKDASGRLYLGSVKGMISFNPAHLTKNQFIPPVYFTGFQVNNKELPINKESPLTQSMIYAKTIELSHDQSSFSIDFAALSFTAPQMNTYAYKMEGVDANWTQLETNRKVYFTDLSPGKYIFKVKSANSSGIWNPQEAMLTIIIHPPWWRTSLAYFIYGLIIIGLVTLLVTNYHKRVRRENQSRIDLFHFEKEKELYEAKMKFFTNIAHEIKTPLTLIKGPLERIIKKTDSIPGIQSSLAIMEKNTDRLLELTNQLLDYRQTESGSFTLNFTEENISELLEEISSSFKPLAEQKAIQYNLNLLPFPLITYADREALTKILNNLLSNAVKYADQLVEISLSVNEKENTYTVDVRNDGYLIPPDLREKIFEPFFRLKKTEKQKGTGIGLALARSLTELHQGKLYVKEDPLMNVFILTLPVHQELSMNKDTVLSNKTNLQESNI